MPTILGELKRHFRDTGWFVHVPRGAQELALTVQQAEEPSDLDALHGLSHDPSHLLGKVKLSLLERSGRGPGQCQRVDDSTI